MHTFKVWAPAARTVVVRIGSKSHPLQNEADGWWQGGVEDAAPGTEYFFELDGGEPVPDPRSAFQPKGIHGPSQLVDHIEFRWTDARWQAPPVSSAIVYELHVGTFTPQGTFLSAIERLDHLAQLGISHIEVMPVAQFSGSSGWGYDGVNLFAPHQAYGTPDDLKQLIDACHAKGLAVLMDVVYNHLGPSGNYLGKFGPYFTDAHHTPWGAAVNLEQAGSHEVRRFFCDNALMWLRDYHCDGLRLDAVHAYVDRSAINFMEQIAAEVCALEAETGRHYVVIAESDLNDPRLVTAPEAGGYGLDAQWSDDFHHALVTALSGDRSGYYADFGSLEQIAKALRDVYVYDGRYAPYRNRIHGKRVAGLPGWRFLGYAQNHDQVGNRATGDRLSQIVSLGRARIAAALVLTAPFVPMIFQGEEWAASSPFQFFTNHDPELGKLVSEGRTKEFARFGWDPADIPDPQAQETYERSKLNWGERNAGLHAEMLEWYRKLIALRRSTPDLLDGDLSRVEVRFSDAGQWLRMKRGVCTVVLSLAKEPAEVDVGPGLRLVLQSDSGIRLHDSHVVLAPDSVAVLVQEAGGS